MLWSGSTQANGNPQTYYEYRCTTTNRTLNSVHVKLELRVKMAYSWNYYSFGVMHSCKVGAGTRDEVLANAETVTTVIKPDRKYWGHQNLGWTDKYYNAGEGMWFKEGDYDYVGDVWHGWYTVFDRDVAVSGGQTELCIIPCIWEQCLCNGPQDSYVYRYNSQEVCNWKGEKGVWVPFGETLYEGYYRNTPCPEDSPFANNRGYEALSPAITVTSYPYLDAPVSMTVTPSTIDKEQTGYVSVISISKVNGATGYQIVASYNGRTYTFQSKSETAMVEIREMFGEVPVGAKIKFRAYAIGSNNVVSPNGVDGTTVEVVEHIAPPAPYSAVLTPASLDIASNTTIVASFENSGYAPNVPYATTASFYTVEFICGDKSYSVNVRSKYATAHLSYLNGVTASTMYANVYAVDQYGYKSEPSVTNTITITKTPSYAPDSFYIVGTEGVNRVAFNGETADIVISSKTDGSLPITLWRLVRLSDGVSYEWQSGTQVRIAGVDKPSVIEEWQLQSYDANGNAVYNREGEWPTVNITYGAGIVAIYDGEWKNGKPYILTADGWHEVMGCYVKRDNGWGE